VSDGVTPGTTGAEGVGAGGVEDVVVVGVGGTDTVGARDADDTNI
jgi:hypothetical protein